MSIAQMSTYSHKTVSLHQPVKPLMSNDEFHWFLPEGLQALACVWNSSCFWASPLPHSWMASVLHASAGRVQRGPQGGVHRLRRPPAGSNGQWGLLGPFQSTQSASATAQLHGRRLSLCLVNYQPAPAFTVMHTQVRKDNQCPKLLG